MLAAIAARQELAPRQVTLPDRRLLLFAQVFRVVRCVGTSGAHTSPFAGAPSCWLRGACVAARRLSARRLSIAWWLEYTPRRSPGRDVENNYVFFAAIDREALLVKLDTSGCAPSAVVTMANCEALVLKTMANCEFHEKEH